MIVDIVKWLFGIVLPIILCLSFAHGIFEQFRKTNINKKKSVLDILYESNEFLKSAVKGGS